MNVILALALAIGAALTAGYSARHQSTTHASALDDGGGPVPLCPPDTPSCN